MLLTFPPCCQHPDLSATFVHQISHLTCHLMRCRSAQMQKLCGTPTLTHLTLLGYVFASSLSYAPGTLRECIGKDSKSYIVTLYPLMLIDGDEVETWPSSPLRRLHMAPIRRGIGLEATALCVYVWVWWRGTSLTISLSCSLFISAVIHSSV